MSTVFYFLFHDNMGLSYVESLEADRAGNGMEAAGSRGGIFGLLRTISYFTYEMIDI